jgi:hypothetical protein
MVHLEAELMGIDPVEQAIVKALAHDPFLPVRER